ncbi:MAG: glutaredoxin family protein [Myxococcales bacterium]|nr:MAG: glutaredoxin family protein [Myxococcales bacterium]
MILYRTSWCGVCKQAAAFFKKQGIAFVEKDIEKEAGAASEMRSKCERAKLQCSGVPVIDVDGRLIEGFNQSAIKELL